jgi:putative nicotinate phosphoribosyltransferase
MDKFNYTMLCDFYELTMGNGYFVSGMQEKISYFDLFFRQIPDGGGFAIACGLEQVINYIENLHFDEEDIEFLRSKGIFDEGFLEYLKDFRFTGDIFAVPEGTVVFPNEPIITVRAPAVQAQLVETYLLLCINHQTLIATKANRIVRAAQGRAVSEFGSRRAHGADAAEVDWQKPATIRGYAMEGTLCVQDFYNMTWEGGTTAKLEAIERLLKVANSEEVAKQYPNMWFINHTSGFKYTSTEFTKEPVSTSEGYRANAADTNKFLAERIKGRMTTGLVMMDFAGVDRSGNYDVMGKRLVQAVINSN